MEDYERALAGYESALRHNPYSVPAMSAIAGVHRTLDRFEKVRKTSSERDKNSKFAIVCARSDLVFSLPFSSLLRLWNTSNEF